LSLLQSIHSRPLIEPRPYSSRQRSISLRRSHGCLGQIPILLVVLLHLRLARTQFLLNLSTLVAARLRKIVLRIVQLVLIEL